MEEVKLQVLLIEDDETDYIGLKRAFDLLGIECDLSLAETGERGWKSLIEFALSTQKIPIILLDFNLPMQTGLETLELIRGSTLTKNARVVVWSGSDDQKYINAAKKLDIEGFLLKSNNGSCYIKAATMLNEYWRMDSQV